jgi:twitching motility protein PilT
MVATAAIRNIIREAKTHQLDAAIQTGADVGMQSMDRVLVQLVHEGKVTYEDAKSFVIDPDEFERILRK